MNADASTAQIYMYRFEYYTPGFSRLAEPASNQQAESAINNISTHHNNNAHCEFMF